MDEGDQSRPGNARRVKVAIVGGGLAGLCAGRLLRFQGIDLCVLEARRRLGGRILTTDETGAPADDGFDLGPSWFWPEMQPALAALVSELGLTSFPQHNDGDVIFQRMSRETPWRYRAAHQEPQSMRLAGGTATLLKALEKSVGQADIVMDARVERLQLQGSAVELTFCRTNGEHETVIAEQVIAALPPRLLAQMAFSPNMDPSALHRWRDTPTWMAPHAKFFAIYDRPFWRDIGLSGTAQSLTGPLAEIHDATTASGAAALFGFPSISADRRDSLGESALTKACLEQLARLFGPEALTPRATIFKDWAADSLTATQADRNGGAHPEISAAAWVTGIWQQHLSLAGSETSTTEPGYMAGAVSAAERAVAKVMQHLGDSGSPRV